MQGVLFPTQVAPGEVCTYTADPTQPMLPTGTLDSAFHDHYDATVLLGNESLQAGSGGFPADEVELRGADVTVEDSTGNVVGTFTTAAAGFVYGEAGNVPGFGTTQITLLDSAITAMLRGGVSAGQLQRLTVNFRVLGSTRGGAAVQTDVFVFPIDVCSGCLVTFAASDVDPSLPLPNCAKGVGQPSSTAVPCVRGQDTPIDCAECQDVPVCRGASADGG